MNVECLNRKKPRFKGLARKSLDCWCFTFQPGKRIHGPLHYSKAVRCWSCPNHQSRDRIIPHRPCMPKRTEPCEKTLTQVGLDPTISRLGSSFSPIFATNTDDYIGITAECCRNAAMRFTANKMLHCRLVL
mgnify:CR=1 FL=1